MTKQQIIRTTTAALLAAAGFIGSASAANIAFDSALNTAGLAVGQSYQLVYVSSTQVTAFGINGDSATQDDSTIADWNAWINTSADGSSITGFGDLNWSAIISTGSADGTTNAVNARDNAVVSQAVYNTGGSLIATGATAMWGGTIALNIDFNENGVEQNTNGGAAVGRQVWSGSKGDGTRQGSHAMGDSDTNPGNYRMGDADATGTVWISQGNSVRRPGTASARVYGLSEVITVVPEPSTTALLGLGGLALILRRRK